MSEFLPKRCLLCLQMISLGLDSVLLTTSSSEGGLTDFSTFLDSFLEQVANNITPSAYKVVDDTTVTVNVMVGPLNHPTRVS